MKIKTLIHIALIGDGVYLLWMLRNGLNSGFSFSGTVEHVLAIFLFLLLSFNFFLLWKRK